MATLTTERRSGKTTGYNVQWCDDKTRRTIYLSGKQYSKKTAEQFKDIIETLLYNKRNNVAVPDKTTAHWLCSAHDDLKTKLATVGLLTVIESKTVKQLWNTFLKHKQDVKLATINKYLECRSKFYEEFAPEESIEKITSERLCEWHTSLLNEYAESTVTLHLKRVCTVLNWAVDNNWIYKSPMQKLPRSGLRSRANDRFITMEEYGKLLDICPNQEWRVIIALARIGGLRCPSELRQLRWKDVDWAQNRFLVHSPKTEHYENHASRLVPLFDELRTELESHVDNISEFVLQNFCGTAWNLYKPFQEIAVRAGLGNIKSPFVNMRRSRSNEVVRRYGREMEKLWIGHTTDVMEKYYLRPMEEDFVAEGAE